MLTFVTFSGTSPRPRQEAHWWQHYTLSAGGTPGQPQVALDCDQPQLLLPSLRGRRLHSGSAPLCVPAYGESQRGAPQRRSHPRDAHGLLLVQEGRQRRACLHLRSRYVVLLPRCQHASPHNCLTFHTTPSFLFMLMPSRTYPREPLPPRAQRPMEPSRHCCRCRPAVLGLPRQLQSRR